MLGMADMLRIAGRSYCALVPMSSCRHGRTASTRSWQLVPTGRPHQNAAPDVIDSQSGLGEHLVDDIVVIGDRRGRNRRITDVAAVVGVELDGARAVRDELVGFGIDDEERHEATAARPQHPGCLA